jgi:hypothetical protein
MPRAERVLEGGMATCLLAPIQGSVDGRFVPQLAELGAEAAVDAL